jgi:ABC-2 type transport system permease protein
MFNKIAAITRKELRSFFNSPIAYIVTGVFLIAMTVLYFVFNKSEATRFADLRVYFNFIPWVFILVIPAITMRSWAEEKKAGTEEILFTLPFKEHELVLGKFTAAFILFFIMLALTLVVPISLSVLGDFEWGQILGQYLGALFLGTACLTVGLFVSALTKNQIIAFLFSSLILFFLVAVNYLNFLVSLPPLLSGFFNLISFRFHYETLGKGLIETGDLMFFVIMSALFLFLNIKVLVFKKWQ